MHIEEIVTLSKAKNLYFYKLCISLAMLRMTKMVSEGHLVSCPPIPPVAPIVPIPPVAPVAPVPPVWEFYPLLLFLADLFQDFPEDLTLNLKIPSHNFPLKYQSRRTDVSVS
jgi:hypothetical protein